MGETYGHLRVTRWERHVDNLRVTRWERHRDNLWMTRKRGNRDDPFSPIARGCSVLSMGVRG